MGVRAAWGRDWVRSEVAIGSSPGAGLEDSFERRVDVLSAGVTLNYVVVRLEADLGWALGAGDDPVQVPGFDPTEGTPLGGLSVRIIF